jgi:hypothetical protein
MLVLLAQQIAVEAVVVVQQIHLQIVRAEQVVQEL